MVYDYHERVGWSMNDDDDDDVLSTGHHTDRWQQQAMYVGIHMPSERKHRSRRRHRRASTDPANAKVTSDTAAPTRKCINSLYSQLLLTLLYV